MNIPVDENVVIFSKKIKVVFENKMRTDDKSFLKDVLFLLDLFPNKKIIKFKFYKSMVIYDEKIYLVLLKERRFKRIIKFMLFMNGDYTKKISF